LNFALISFFNETLHDVKLCILPRLEACRIMQDKPVVAGLMKFFIDVGFPWEIVKGLLLRGSVWQHEED
jgi:hypothetical protein